MIRESYRYIYVKIDRRTIKENKAVKYLGSFNSSHINVMKKGSDGMQQEEVLHKSNPYEADD